jgi:DnaK suppressor protein
MTAEPAPRERIVIETERTRAQLVQLSAALDAIMDAADASPPDDEHDPDGATVGFERAQAAALVDMAGRRLVELGAALDRVEAGTYGRCTVCGGSIAPARLDALPTATTCVPCAAPRR